MLPQVAWQTATHAKRVMVYATQTVKFVQPFYLSANLQGGGGGGLSLKLPIPYQVTRCQEVHIRRNEVPKLC